MNIRQQKDIVLGMTKKILIPFILVFGMYITFHGHLTPGGGFAGGTVMAAALILGCISEERESMETYRGYLIAIICISLMAYGVIKAFGTLLPEQMHGLAQQGMPGHLISGGLILPLNIMVGLAVACALFIFFTLIGDGCNE